jgi:RNA polymerase sigma factor (sigma-70 family)
MRHIPGRPLRLRANERRAGPSSTSVSRRSSPVSRSRSSTADLETLQRSLSQRERTIVRLRFEHDLTQQEIGELVGLSHMQISRILRSAIARLREHAERSHGDRLAA